MNEYRLFCQKEKDRVLVDGMTMPGPRLVFVCFTYYLEVNDCSIPKFHFTKYYIFVDTFHKNIWIHT